MKTGRKMFTTTAAHLKPWNHVGKTKCTKKNTNTTTASSDMRFVESFTPPDFEAKTFTPPTSPNLNSFSDKNKKIIENGEIYTAGENFTLPPTVTGGTFITSGRKRAGTACLCFVFEPLK